MYVVELVDDSLVVNNHEIFQLRLFCKKIKRRWLELRRLSENPRSALSSCKAYVFLLGTDKLVCLPGGRVKGYGGWGMRSFVMFPTTKNISPLFRSKVLSYLMDGVTGRRLIRRQRVYDTLRERIFEATYLVLCSYDFDSIATDDFEFGLYLRTRLDGDCRCVPVHTMKGYLKESPVGVSSDEELLFAHLFDTYGEIPLESLPPKFFLGMRFSSVRWDASFDVHGTGGKMLYLTSQNGPMAGYAAEYLHREAFEQVLPVSLFGINFRRAYSGLKKAQEQE